MINTKERLLSFFSAYTTPPLLVLLENQTRIEV